MMDEKTLKIAAAVLLCTTIAAGALALQYNYQLSRLKEDYGLILQELEEYTALVNIKIDYGDRVIWYNGTRISLGSSVIDATSEVVELEVQEMELGSFVTSVGGVAGDASHFWIWSYYVEGWETVFVGADQWTLHNGDVVAWTYTTSFE